MLKVVERWLHKAMAGSLALDRWALAHLADAMENGVPAVDRAIERGRRLLSGGSRARR
jgi:hypothetical protein